MLGLWLGFCLLGPSRAPDTASRAHLSYLALMFISLAARLVPHVIPSQPPSTIASPTLIFKIHPPLPKQIRKQNIKDLNKSHI